MYHILWGNLAPQLEHSNKASSFRFGTCGNLIK